MIINLSRVLALEIAEKPSQEKNAAGDWVPKSSGEKVYSLVFYQFAGDAKSRQAVIEPSQVEGVKQLLRKPVDISLDQRIYDNGNQKMTLVGISASK